MNEYIYQQTKIFANQAKIIVNLAQLLKIAETFIFFPFWLIFKMTPKTKKPEKSYFEVLEMLTKAFLDLFKFMQYFVIKHVTNPTGVIYQWRHSNTVNFWHPPTHLYTQSLLSMTSFMNGPYIDRASEDTLKELLRELNM